MQVAMPTRILPFSCDKEEAASRVIKRGRTSNDTAEVFARRYVEFETNNARIMELYPDLAVNVRGILATAISSSLT